MSRPREITRGALVGAAAVALAACFDPQISTGAPCDPVAPLCPRGQSCAAGPSGHTCMPAGSVADAPPPRADATDLVDASAPEADAAALHLELVATVAECIDPLQPDPAMCRAANGGDQIAVDLLESVTGHPWNAYVRFDVDGSIAGRTVTSVVLQLTATDSASADSPDGGTVWAVEPFDTVSLQTTTPAHVGTMPLAGSYGPVAELEVAEWSLPVSAVDAGERAHFGLESASSNGAQYWNLAGPDPPRLIIDAQ